VEEGVVRWGNCDAEKALLPWLLSCHAVQKLLPVRTISASSAPLSSWYRADGVVLLEAEMVDEEREEEDAMGVRGVVHPEDWKYSQVGMESTAGVRCARVKVGLIHSQHHHMIKE
jgi:hypothetical protein